jgi:1-acyl-sn-glycerol-3-phosphate acyltransferase
VSALDHLVLPAMTRRVIYNISKIEHFHSPTKAWFFRHWGVIPLDRGRGDNAALEQAKDVLRSGELFCIYPEGTRSLDGKLHKGHTGVARLALAMDVPVVPVAMIGTFEKKPKGQKGIQWKGKTGGIAGPPMHWPQFAGMHENRKICRQVTDEVMRAIAALSGQEYVHEYQHNPDVPGYDRKGAKRAAAEEEDLAVEHRG